MYVYIWKRPDGTPFYVGATKRMRRTDPLCSGGRGRLCKKTMAEIGPENIIVELHRASTVEEANVLEQKFIAQYGRIQLNTGPLTNLRKGGEGTRSWTPERKAAQSARMKLHNPFLNPEVRARAIATQRSPHAIQKMQGENNPAKRPEVSAKIKAKWAEPGYKERMHEARLGKLKHTEAHKAELREQLLDPSNPLREYHKVLNADPAIIAKRNATLRTPEARAAMADKSKMAWNQRSAEVRARQTARSKEPHSAESRAKMSAALKTAWARRKAAE